MVGSDIPEVPNRLLDRRGDDHAGTSWQPGRIDLVQQAVAKAESQKLSVTHICVIADSAIGKVLEQAGLSKVRTYLDMLWRMDELAELELP